MRLAAGALVEAERLPWTKVLAPKLKPVDEETLKRIV
jgi:hypothetical protein